MTLKKQRISSSTRKFDLLNLALLFLIVLFDQATKYLIRTNIPLNGSVDIGKILSFTYVQNTGISFGMLKGFNWIFTLIAIFAFILFGYFYLTERKFQYIFILAGIAGNLIDRLLLGYVVDFINFHYWPIFNIADSMISIGIVWIILLSVKDTRTTLKKGY
ncbi:MAG: signal peptidase II [Candidatus Woesearchaeota archaeon]|nr:signal peptidase II [Candidatus Woesearchaeota archaeon]